MTDERVALVTGAGRGIGAATVRLLAAQGMRVVAVDSCAGDDAASSGVGYPLATAADLRSVIEPLGEAALGVEADVRDRDALDDAVRQARERWGRVDVVVAAAAVVAGGRPLREDASLDTLWQVDVAGVWNTATATVPAMLAGPDPSGCRFVALTSAAGSQGLFHLAAYSTVKHAVVGLVRGLAADLIGTGVTAVAVAPGPTRTPMLDATADLYGVDTDELARTLLRDSLDPAEIAATVAFCCSREGRVLNGSVVAADGGFFG